MLALINLGMMILAGGLSSLGWARGADEIKFDSELREGWDCGGSSNRKNISAERKWLATLDSEEGRGWPKPDRSQRVNRLTLLYSVMHCKDVSQGRGLADEKWENRRWGGLQLPPHRVSEIQTCLSTLISHTSFLARPLPFLPFLNGTYIIYAFCTSVSLPVKWQYSRWKKSERHHHKDFSFQMSYIIIIQFIIPGDFFLLTS